MAERPNQHSRAFIASLVVLLAPGLSLALPDSLARTPTLGWNNWNAFACDVSEHLLLSTADRIVSLGLRDVGYDHVVLDDCWQDPAGRDEHERLQPDRSKFPRGMKAISDDLHALGLKYGMYSSAGELTCARFAGSLGYEANDAKSFASWGVDYLKYDNCFNLGQTGTPQASFQRYEHMSRALRKADRPITYSICSWGEDLVHSWGVSIANSWRISGDIYDAFSRPDDLCSCTSASDPLCVSQGVHCSVLFILNRVAPIADRAYPGGWNDLDMLEVGRGGMTDEEYKAHFALWAALKSPLLLGNDLRIISPEALTIVNNPAIIALSQDPSGRSAIRIQHNIGGSLAPDEYGVAETQIWSGGLANGDQVVILLNVAAEDVEMTAQLSEIFVANGPRGSAPQARSSWAIHDLWANRMPNETAEALLKAPDNKAGQRILQEANWYNASEVPYKEGLEKGDPRLFGEKVGEIKAGGLLKAKVLSHSAKVYRLRRISGPDGAFGVGPASDEL